jgi:hypothetical protein
MYVWMQPLSYPFLQLLILRNSKFEDAWKFWFVFSEANGMSLSCTEIEQNEVQFPTDKKLYI